MSFPFKRVGRHCFEALQINLHWIYTMTKPAKAFFHQSLAFDLWSKSNTPHLCTAILFLHFFAVSRKSSPLATLCHFAPFLCRNLPSRLQQIHYRLGWFSFRTSNGWVSPGGLLLSWQQTHLAGILKELSFILVDPQVARYYDILRFTHAAEALHAEALPRSCFAGGSSGEH